MNYEAWNRYVLTAIGLFAVLLYGGLLYAGIAEFRSRLSQPEKSNKRSRNRLTARGLRNGKASGD